MLNKDAPVLCAEVAVLLEKDAIEPVPPAEMESGFYRPYFIVPKKGRGLRPILDLRAPNRALHKLPFRMLTQRRIFQCICPFDWFAAIDLKDAYFHVSILPRHRPSPLCIRRASIPVQGPPLRAIPAQSRALCNGHAAAGLWTGPQLQWHINCLELLAVWLALRRFKTLLHEKHALVRTDNTATVAYIKHQGGLCSRSMSQLARHLLLWSQKHLRSLHAIHVPGELNRAADKLSRQPALPEEWRLHPEVLQLIWRRFGDALVDLMPPRTRLTVSCFSPCPRGPSVQMRWHAAGLGAYANMCFPQ